MFYRSNVKNICEGKNPHFYIYLIFSGSWIGPYIPVPILAWDHTVSQARLEGFNPILHTAWLENHAPTLKST